MTGGGKHCWQQHVIWEWNTSRSLRLNLNHWSGFFFPFFFSSPPSDETISSEQRRSSLNGNNEKQVREVDTKVDPDSDDGVVCWGRGKAAPHETSSFYRRLPHNDAGQCCWHVTGGLADFVSLPELLWDNMSVRDISVRVSVWACQHLLVYVCVWMWTSMASHLFEPALEDRSWTVVEFQLERKKALYGKRRSIECGSESWNGWIAWLG